MDMFSFLFLNLVIYQGVELLGHVVNLSDANDVEHLFMCILTYFYFNANSSAKQCAFSIIILILLFFVILETMFLNLLDVYINQNECVLICMFVWIYYIDFVQYV